jgi:hypothetical protein
VAAERRAKLSPRSGFAADDRPASTISSAVARGGVALLVSLSTAMNARCF